MTAHPEPEETPKPSTPLLSMQGVSVFLNGGAGLTGIDWAIRSDEHWVVLGPGNSGKSLLVRALCGEVPIASGRIISHEQGADPFCLGAASLQEIAGVVSFDAQKRFLRREAGYHQARWNSLSAEESPTVSDYLSQRMVLRINPFEVHPKTPDPALFLERRKEIVALVGIGELMEKHLAQLSSGETRKLLIARALLRNPRLLVFDNPFAGLDPGYRETLRSTLGRLMKGSMRMVLVAERPEEIPPGITHGLLLREYGIIAQGPLNEVLDKGCAQGAWVWEEGPAKIAPPRPAVAPPHPDRPAPVLVEMKDVRIRYGKHEILRGVDWTVRKGEHWVIMGKNGSGKSTLLSLILGDNPQGYANAIRLFGVPRGSGESIWEIKERIGYVSPELHAYIPRGMTCDDVLCSGFFDSIGLYRTCSGEQRETASQWLGRAGLREHRARPFHAIPAGEQRMVLLARALVKGPLLLILDEPCQGLDLCHRKRFLERVDEAGARMHATIVYVTHVPEEVPSLTTHRLVLDAGRIVEKGPWSRRDEERLAHRTITAACDLSGQ